MAMPVGYCPSCEKGIDLDGFGEHGVPTLWYCYCRKIFAMGPNIFDLKEIVKEEIDLSANFPYGKREPKPGEFIHALRWTCIRKVAEKNVWEQLRNFSARTIL